MEFNRNSSTFQKKRHFEEYNQPGKVKRRFIKRHLLEVKEVGFSRLDALKWMEKINLQVASVAPFLHTTKRDLQAPQQTIALVQQTIKKLGEAVNAFTVLFAATNQAFTKHQQLSYHVFEDVMKLSSNNGQLLSDGPVCTLSGDTRASVDIAASLQRGSDQMLWLSNTMAFMIQAWKTVARVYEKIIRTSGFPVSSSAELENVKHIADTYERTKSLFDSSTLVYIG